MSQAIKPPLPSRSLVVVRQLRDSSTDAERRLWQSLRAGQLDGLKFRGPHPLPLHVADFYCGALKLVVELDGSQACRLPSGQHRKIAATRHNTPKSTDIRQTLVDQRGGSVSQPLEPVQKVFD